MFCESGDEITEPYQAGSDSGESRSHSTLLTMWTQLPGRPIFIGLVFGCLWGFLAAADATPAEWLVYDPAEGVVYEYISINAEPRMVPEQYFFSHFNDTLIKVTLTHLLLAAVSGWATWKLLQIRPRGDEQPALRKGSDWYLIGLAIGGYLSVLLFSKLGLAAWFKGDPLTPARAVTDFLGLILPLYIGLALFLVWFRRLKSVRAPDWETHYSKPTMKLFEKLVSRLLGKKGGDSSKT